MADTVSMITLVSSEGKNFEVPREVAKLSSTVNTLMADLGMNDDSDTATMPVPLPNVNTATLEKVIEWCIHHKDDAPVVEVEEDKKDKRTDNIPQWDQDFYNVDQSVLFELILAANYLDIKLLLDIGCKTVANMIKGKSPEEIRTTFGIVNDFTPEEEEQIRKENAWCED